MGVLSSEPLKERPTDPLDLNDRRLQELADFAPGPKVGAGWSTRDRLSSDPDIYPVEPLPSQESKERGRTLSTYRNYAAVARPREASPLAHGDVHGFFDRQS